MFPLSRGNLFVWRSHELFGPPFPEDENCEFVLACRHQFHHWKDPGRITNTFQKCTKFLKQTREERTFMKSRCNIPTANWTKVWKNGRLNWRELVWTSCGRRFSAHLTLKTRVATSDVWENIVGMASAFSFRLTWRDPSRSTSLNLSSKHSAAKCSEHRWGFVSNDGLLTASNHARHNWSFLGNMKRYIRSFELIAAAKRYTVRHLEQPFDPVIPENFAFLSKSRCASVWTRREEFFFPCNLLVWIFEELKRFVPKYW